MTRQIKVAGWLLRAHGPGLVTAIAFVLAASSHARATGGEACGSATVVGPLPYTDSGTTCGALNTYSETCPTNSSGPDVVYRYTAPSQDQMVDISLCSVTNYDAKLYVYASDHGNCPAPGSGDTSNDVACADSGCGGSSAQVPRINGLLLSANVVYHIVVDGTQGACGNYQITISQSVVDPGPACCQGASCSELSPADCANSGGFSPPGVENCDAATCVLGACCLGPGVCSDNAAVGMTESACAALGGTYIGGARCTNSPCAVIPCDNNSDCDDQNPCTADYCDPSAFVCQNTPIAGCCKTNVDCLDGLFCNGAESCVQHVCQAGIPKNCNDGDSCTQDSCDETADRCVHTLLPQCCGSNADCNDSNDCTIDTCQAGSCGHAFAAQGTACGDRTVTACSGADTCNGQGICNPRNLPAGTACGDSSDTSCTIPDVCDSNGICHEGNRPDGTACSDGDACTGPDSCASGICTGPDNGVCQACAQGGSAADSTNQIGFQALLRDGAGHPIPDGQVSLSFQFYSDQGAAIGAPIAVTQAQVTNGVVSTGIPITQTIFDGTARQLGVSVNGTPELSPRIPVRSAAQAFITQCANSEAVTDHLDVGANQNGGSLRIVDPAGGAGLVVDATAEGTSLHIGDTGGERTLLSRGALLYAASVSHGLFDICGRSNELTLQNPDLVTTITLDPSTCDYSDRSGRILIGDADGDTSIHLQAGSPAEIALKENNVEIVQLSTFDDGTLYLGTKKSDGTYPIQIESVAGTCGSRVTTDTLKIRGGSDLSEMFEVGLVGEIRPGMVVSIDPSQPGRLMLSTDPYDRKVVGVVSGAGPIKAGLLLTDQGTLADGATPVALTGRVYVWVDAAFGVVEPGDFLTTSSASGFAMKVSDASRAQGAILGKAMTGISAGRGLVLVLVTLQ